MTRKSRKYTGKGIEKLRALSKTGDEKLVLFDSDLVEEVKQVPLIATASLPAAGSFPDGTIVIEDNGTGDRNLIIYAGGQRFRIDGGVAV